MASVEVLGVPVVDKDLTDAPAKVQRAFVRAANRSIASGRTVMTRLIAADTGIVQRFIRDRILLDKATMANPVASLKASSKRIPLIAFKARGPMPTKGQGRGVSYRNPGGGRSTISTGFIAMTRAQDDGSGGEHKGVFIRAAALERKSRGAWSKNLPMKQLFGPSVGQVFSKFRQQGVERTLEVFEDNFDHELDFANSGGGISADAD